MVKNMCWNRPRWQSPSSHDKFSTTRGKPLFAPPIFGSIDCIDVTHPFSYWHIPSDSWTTFPWPTYALPFTNTLFFTSDALRCMSCPLCYFSPLVTILTFYLYFYVGLLSPFISYLHISLRGVSTTVDTFSHSSYIHRHGQYINPVLPLVLSKLSIDGFSSTLVSLGGL